MCRCKGYGFKQLTLELRYIKVSGWGHSPTRLWEQSTANSNSFKIAQKIDFSIFRFCEIYWEYARSSKSIKIGTNLSIDKSIKVGKSDLIDINCIDQSVEIDDTLVSFIDLFEFYRFHRFLLEADICSSVHPKMKTDFMQTVNLLTIELQVRVEGSNNLLSLFKKSWKKSYLFFKTRFKVFFGWPIMARFFIFPSFWSF